MDDTGNSYVIDVPSAQGYDNKVQTLHFLIVLWFVHKPKVSGTKCETIAPIQVVFLSCTKSLFYEQFIDEKVESAGVSLRLFRSTCV